MAASQRSPLMRDRGRANVDSSARLQHRATDGRDSSPSAPRRKDRSSEGLRIRGRAANEALGSAVKKHREDGKGQAGSAQVLERVRNRTHNQETTDEPTGRGHRGTKDKVKGGAKDRFEDRHTERRRRSPNRPAAQDIFDFRDAGTRRSPSPANTRLDRASHRYSSNKGRPQSPSRAPREDHYSSAGRFSDSYVPSSRRSPRPTGRQPHYKEEYDRKGQHKPQRERGRPRRASLTPPRRETSSRFRSPYRDTQRAPVYRPKARSRESHSSRRPSTSPFRTGQHRRKREASRSPARKRARRDRSRGQDMQHSHATSPPQPIPSYGASNPHHGGNYPNHYSMHGMQGSHRPMRPPPVDTRHPHLSSPHWTPTSSQHGSPHSASPYSHGRGGWAGQQQYHSQASMNAYSPPHRQNSYPPQPSPSAQYYLGGQHSPYVYNQQPQHGFQPQNMRGNLSSFRGNHIGPPADRRLSGSSSSPTRVNQPARSKFGTFQNLQWTAGDTPKARATDTARQIHHDDEEDNPFRPSKDLQVEDQENASRAKAESAASPKGGSKISFAFKTKPTPSAGGKPPPDLLQRGGDPSREKVVASDSKSFRKEDKGPRDIFLRDNQDKYRAKDARYDIDVRHERDHKHDQGRGRSWQKKIFREKRPQRTLSPGLADSSSVYYRKPGNESVVGSGTYGKVFKAIHVYTKNLAALKKIRMDGEKDGFPVTAVREIKLLQSINHENVVSLQEVMVEHNDCFMVFEYLSHDLTGLLNHPTFKLEHAHKKHLSRQLFEGLNHLHRRGVLHRDIKAANILISSEGQLKLADFGLARFYSKRGRPDYTNRVITIWYRSPELLLGETQYGPAVDIWSAACVMVEIFTRHAIFPGDGGEINQLDKIYNVLGTPVRSEWPGLIEMAWFELLRPTERKPNTFGEKYQGRVTSAAFELLTAMFRYDPNKRPTAADVLEHPYFTIEDPAPRQAIE